MEEPFDTTRNLGNSSDMTSSKGLKEEFRRALDILYQKCSLDQVCAQYVFPPSYYNSNNNYRKGGNSNSKDKGDSKESRENRENSYAGRRYINSYRSNNYYYDDQDYDDDDDEEDEELPREISVMETLNIGTRPSTSKNPISNSNGDSKASKEGGGSRSSLSKDTSSSGSKGESNRSQSRNRSRTKEGTESSSASTPAKSGSRSSSSKEKSGSTGSSSSSTRNRKKGSGGGDGQKNGRSGGSNNSGGGSRARSTVEFSLAEIANVAPKLLSAKKERGSNQSEANGDTSGSGAGEEGSPLSTKGRRKGHKNVVWSTNSNRGETTRRQGGGVKANNGPVEPAEKAKVIFVQEEELSSDGSGPTPRPSSVASEA